MICWNNIRSPPCSSKTTRKLHSIVFQIASVMILTESNSVTDRFAECHIFTDFQENNLLDAFQ